MNRIDEKSNLNFEPQLLALSCNITESTNLAGLIQKANDVAGKARQASESYWSICKSYEYYSEFPDDLVRDHLHTALKDLRNLGGQEQELRGEIRRVIREFSRFSSVHHIDYLKNKEECDQFKKEIDFADRYLCFYTFGKGSVDSPCIKGRYDYERGGLHYLEAQIASKLKESSGILSSDSKKGCVIL